MFCHGCLAKLLEVLYLAYRFAQASVAALRTGDVFSAYAHAHNFAALWSVLIRAARGETA